MDTKLNLAHVSTALRTSNKYFKCVLVIECTYHIQQRFGEFARAEKQRWEEDWMKKWRKKMFFWKNENIYYNWQALRIN